MVWRRAGEIQMERMKLNAAVVSKLAAEGVPAVGVSPLGGWTTDQRRVHSHNCDAVQSLLHTGLVPVRTQSTVRILYWSA
jgi:isopentenyl phosphate kinase